MTHLAWMFTIYNYEEVDPRIDEWQTQYVIWQEEQCPETGRMHIQGYCTFPKQKRLSGVKKLHDTAHWEPRRGTHEEAKAYCSKEDTRLAGPFSFGIEPKGSGHRSDLEEIKEKIKTGVPEKQVWDENFGSSVRYYRAFREYRRLITPERNFKTEVTVIWGPTGTGKSRHCQETYPGAYWMNKGKWFDGYENQDVIVIDEFYGWLPYDTLLRALDRYPMQVETKGGHVQFAPKKIILTSNSKPQQWYRDGIDYAPLERRIDYEYEYLMGEKICHKPIYGVVQNQ